MTWVREASFRLTAAAILAAVGLVMGVGASAIGEEKSKNLPPRSILVSPEYTGIVVSEGEDVSIDLTVRNLGRKHEDIDLKLVSVPKGWRAWIKTYSFQVTGVHVKSDSSKSLTLRVEPDKGVGPGSYTFGIEAHTRDRKLSSSSRVMVQVKGKKEEKKPTGVSINTSYPVLKGPTDAKFEFSLEVENKLEKDTIFNLSAQGPENWEINFKPAYEQKLISSLRLKRAQSQTMAVEVKPYPLAKAGKYPIRIKVGSAAAKGEALLTVILTGTYKMDIGTATGLLSLEAIRGQRANLSFYVKNSGSASLNNIRFLSLKPENWKVDFNPERIDKLAPGALKQIEVTVTPAEQALVGDYSVGLSVKAGTPPRADKSLELRVTVRASAAWAWVGIGIIILVMAGLVILFIRLGRR
jgi:uncharacterized membrane protein